ncbi:CBS domain-containing protein [Pseudomaricurvus sp. HS19]|uniref:CBS domain-containing protein n=1 Tax=Pseudomaricurvus sp. HS19 TaxID=2692626 RepID=UPI001367E275|nr:CBS domain-containing protein [Pseudomaricurvus sp. HS19]MYM62664.1 CBS domain-containing protein [Pseudomaricurvus sp. HS19]
MHSILVKDYMSPEHYAVHADVSVRTAVDAMLRARVLGVPVVDDHKRLVGYVSEQDCIKELLNDAMYCDESAPVASVMQTAVVSFDPEASVVEVAQSMLRHHHKNYPVIQDGKLIGVISRSMVLAALMDRSNACFKHK